MMMDSNINLYLKQFESLKQNYSRNVSEKNYIINNVKTLENDIENLKSDEILLSNSIDLLTKVSNKSRELAKEKLEVIVKKAIQYAFEGDAEFLINLDVKRGVPSVDFRIVKIVNGKKSIQNPISSNGGGLVDICSTALRYSYLLAVDENLAKIIVLDEPGKMVSEDISIKYAKFVKYLCDSFGIQTIFVTHNNELEELTPNVIRIRNKNNKSIIDVS